MKNFLFKIYRFFASKLSGHHLGIFPPFRFLSGLFLEKMRDPLKPVLVNDYLMFLDPKDSLRLSVHQHEPYETEILKKEIKPGDTVVDVGAHIGYYTLLFSKLVGPSGKVFSFEPAPQNFSILEKNINFNSCKNVILINKAVGNQPGLAKIHLTPSTGDFNFVDTKEDKQELELPIITLDGYFSSRGNTQIDFIKMDIEGYEPRALSGMKNILLKTPKMKMLVEFYPKMLRKAGCNPSDLLKFIFEAGFKIYAIQDKVGSMVPMKIEDLLRFYCFNRVGNIFCVKE